MLLLASISLVQEANEMGAVEETAKAAGSFIDSLKSQPLSLALVLMNICLLGFFWLILTKVAEQRQREIQLLYEDKKEVRELIARCIVPEQRSDLRIESAPLLPIPIPRPKPEEIK
jgi:hypothetical protein